MSTESRDGPFHGAGRGSTTWVRLRRRTASLSVWIELIRNLAVRDVETRYKHSLLGLYWAIVNPLLSAFIYAFVFGTILHASATNGQPYVLFILTGFTFWNLFANGAMSAAGSITGSASLLAKLYFPRVVLPTASVLARVIDFLFSVVVLAIFVVATRTPVHWSAFWLIPLLGLELVFSLGFAYLVSALNVLYRDVTQLLGLLLMIWVWITPVMVAVPRGNVWIQAIFLLNPLGGIVQAQRDVLYAGHLTSPSALWSAVAWCGFAFVGGLAAFKRAEPMFAEVM